MLGDNNNFMMSFLINQIGWSYFGQKNWKNSRFIETTNIVEKIDGNFPPTYITDGNSFSFMEHGKELESKLKDKNVYVESYYPSETNQNVDFVHEYQFDFENYHQQALENLNLTIDFLHKLSN